MSATQRAWLRLPIGSRPNFTSVCWSGVQRARVQTQVSKDSTKKHSFHSHFIWTLIPYTYSSQIKALHFLHTKKKKKTHKKASQLLSSNPKVEARRTVSTLWLYFPDASAAAESLTLHKSLISSSASFRALRKTAELVPVFSQKLDTQKMMWSDCGL